MSCVTSLPIRVRQVRYISSLPSILPTALDNRQTRIPSSCRSYSRTPKEEQNNAAHHVDSTSKRTFDAALEEEMLAIQDAAIAELESRLGKSLEEALKEDYLAEIVPELNSERENTVQRIRSMHEAESPLRTLRRDGASSEEVAREARNIFGDYLPKHALSSQETVIYERMYGKAQELISEDRDVYIEETEPDNTLFDVDGTKIAYQLEDEEQIADDMASQVDFDEITEDDNVHNMPFSESSVDEAALAQVAEAVGGDLVDQEGINFDDEEASSDQARSHPLTRLGRFSTFPRTTFLPRDTFVEPVEKVMSSYSNKHLKEACERLFGGPGLPDSPLTPRSGRSRGQKPLPLEASQQAMGQMEANAFITSVMPPTYASISATLVETRKRLGPSWLNKLLAQPGGPRVLDAGSAGVGILAWREIIQAHWDSLHSSDRNPPPAPESKAVVLTGSDTLRHRATTLLENTTFVPRLPDYVHTRQRPNIDDDRPVQQRKQFDVIIASHSLFPLKEEWERKQHVQNLWSLLSDEGGVLILIEKGIPRGFETIAAARDMLLERYIAVPDGQTSSYSSNDAPLDENDLFQKSKGMIVAPCTNHDKCPMFKSTGISHGRKDICSFQQRYIRPPFLQRVLGARDRNHDDVEFSYISVMKGDDLRTRAFSTWDHVNDPLSAPSAAVSDTALTVAEQQESALHIQDGFEDSDPDSSDSPAPPPAHVFPRMVNEPLKRQGHITMDLCTPQGEIRRWTIPKSFSHQAYRDARKARWGDLWALGAKTNVPRNLKLGTPTKDLVKGEGKPNSRQARMERQAMKVLEAEEDAKIQEQQEQEEFLNMLEEEEMDAEDDELIDMETLLPKKKSKAHSQASKQPSYIDVRSRSAPDASTSTTETNAQPAPPKSRARSQFIQSLDSEPLTINGRRARIGEENPLSALADDYDQAMLEDEARKRATKLGQSTGRRATQRNVLRLKREIRRAKRAQAQEA